jgi:hypothetical protein
METIDIIYASWYYSDRWNGSEESGCTLHKNMEDFEQFVKNYHDSFTNERVIGSYHIARKPKTAKVTSEIYEKILATPFGLKVSAEEEPEMVKQKKLVLE